MKGFFTNTSASHQLGLLICLFLVGFLLFTAVFMLHSSPIYGPDGSSSYHLIGSDFYSIQATQFLSAVLILLLPAIGLAFLCSERLTKYLYLYKMTDVRVYLLTTLMLLFISPAMDIVSHFNANMQLPDSMALIESLMRKSEDLAREATMRLLSEEGILPLIVNIIVIAVMAGVAEEFFFRGALLPVVKRIVKNRHVAIWLVAILFSAIHFQFYGFVPRMLLGALLGYLMYWSGSLWIPVFAHFLNNAIAVVGIYFMSDREDFLKRFGSLEPEMNPEELPAMAIAAVVGLVLFAVCVKLMKRICPLRENH